MIIWMVILEKEIKNLLSFLVRETGLAIRSDRIPSLQEKVAERMSASGFDGRREYVHFITSSPEGREEFYNLVDLLTVGETYFFRNEHHFKALTEGVLPDLIDKKNIEFFKDSSKRPSLRVWCAGCSTGEEPYSLAIMLREKLPNFMNWDLSILATDINSTVLDVAREGKYGKRSVSRIPREYLEKYFTMFGEKYFLDESIKGMVKFMHHNLVGDSCEHEAMSGLDMVFCRNVTIYFDFDTTKLVMSRFAEHLLPKGYIFIGHAETLWNVSSEFKPVELPGTFIYQRVEGEKECIGCEMSVPNLSMPSYEVKGVGSVPDVAELMARGTALADRGEFEEALVCAREVAELDNLYASAYYLAGVLLEKLERFEESIDEFRRALYIDSDLAICYFNLGSILSFLKRSDDAKREYENCLKFLDGRDENEEIVLTEGMTVGVLSQAVYRALESLNGGNS